MVDCMTGINISKESESSKCRSIRLPEGLKPNFSKNRIVRMQIKISSQELSTETNKVGGKVSKYASGGSDCERHFALGSAQLVADFDQNAGLPGIQDPDQAGSLGADACLTQLRKGMLASQRIGMNRLMDFIRLP